MFSRDQFAAMAEQLAEIRGTFVMSINDVAPIHELFAGFMMTPVSTSYSVGKTNDQTGGRAELLVSNTDLVGGVYTLFQTSLNSRAAEYQKSELL